MKRLTDKEIDFIKETHFTPTVLQCDEYGRTPFKDYAQAEKTAKETYGIDLPDLMEKCASDDDIDAISLEYAATYILYTFFSKRELLSMKASDALKALTDFRYYFGYRKWDESKTAECMMEAIQIYDGAREFYSARGHMWNREKDDG